MISSLAQPNPHRLNNPCILGAGINLTFIFWQPQVATWGYSHFQAKISLREILA